MTGDSQAILAEFAAHLNAAPFKSVEVTGYTDSLGSPEYNQKLSERRARAIQEYLVRQYHFDSQKIIARGLGEADPIADNGNFQGRIQNRRVEFSITH
jgi:outer membrane protein OmpA-like peptidoglycan-associated protein